MQRLGARDRWDHDLHRNLRSGNKAPAALTILGVMRFRTAPYRRGVSSGAVPRVTNLLLLSGRLRGANRSGGHKLQSNGALARCSHLLPGILSNFGAYMGEIVRFIPKSELERARLIREARALYESIFPSADPVSDRRDPKP
jgi:hypothetical protein